MNPSTLEKVLVVAREKFADADGIDAVVKFDFDGEVSITVDARQSPAVVEANSDLDPDCTVIASEETFRALFAGDLSPTKAFMTGKMRVEGGMGVAMRIGTSFS